MTTFPTISDSMTKSQVENAANTFVPIIWRDEVLAQREHNLVLSKCVRRVNHKGEPGDTIRIPFISNLSAYSKTAGASVTVQYVAEGFKAISLDRHYESSFMLDDFLKVQSKYNLRKYYTEKAGYALAAELDTYVGTAILADLNAAYKVIGSDGTTAFAAGNESDITDSGLLKMIQTLNENDVPGEQRYAVIHPSQVTALLSIDKFVLYHNINRTMELQNGEIGSLYGVKFMMSTNLPTTTGASANSAKINFLLHKECAAVAVQQDVRVLASYQHPQMGTLITHDHIYGVKALRVAANDTSSSNNRKTHVIAFYTK